jgi:hypothetical protein
MPPSRLHFDDLKRRYRETDWVSEYQRLWAIFNYWFKAHFGCSNDRDCIERIKKDSNLDHWTQNVIKKSDYKHPHRVTDGYGGSYPRFAANNVISQFFLASITSPVLEPRINWPWRKGTEPHRVRETNAITLTENQFRCAYNVHASVLASEQGMVYGETETLHQVLHELGIYATGCCFYKGTITVGSASPTSVLANMTLSGFRAKESLSTLVNLAESAKPTSLAEDIVETLYNLRNVAIHGDLDFLNENNNAAARAGCDLLDALLRDIRDHW